MAIALKIVKERLWMPLGIKVIKKKAKVARLMNYIIVQNESTIPSRFP